jgi:ribosomal protein S18 acetylase RimI-like enzyme
MELNKLIRDAKKDDLLSLEILADQVRKNMSQEGLKQWIGNYPNYQHFEKDLLDKGLFVYELSGEVAASISLLPENDLPYQEIKWESKHALVIHRIMVNPKYQHQGIAKQLINYALDKAKSEGYDAIKIDTHPNNLKMQKMLEGFNFIYKGYLESINRLAYELML